MCSAGGQRVERTLGRIGLSRTVVAPTDDRAGPQPAPVNLAHDGGFEQTPGRIASAKEVVAPTHDLTVGCHPARIVQTDGDGLERA